MAKAMASGSGQLVANTLNEAKLGDGLLDRVRGLFYRKPEQGPKEEDRWSDAAERAACEREMNRFSKQLYWF
jgi:hypothetical protein